MKKTQEDKFYADILEIRTKWDIIFDDFEFLEANLEDADWIATKLKNKGNEEWDKGNMKLANELLDAVSSLKALRQLDV